MPDYVALSRFVGRPSVRWRSARRHRRGLNLVELVVALAIAMSLLVLGGVFFQNVTGAKEYSAVRTFVSQVKLAQQQATIENRAYRIAFNLDAGTYTIEASDEEALTYRNAEQRQEVEEKLQDSMGAEKGEEELMKLIQCAKARQKDPSRSCGELDEMDPEQALAMIETQTGTGFASVDDQFFKAQVELPTSVRLSGVYTPAYGEYVRPADEEDVDEEGPVMAFAHIFPGGTTEHTVVQFSREGYDDFGYTVELEPLSGKIVVDNTVREWDEREYEIPEEGPELSS